MEQGDTGTTESTEVEFENTGLEAEIDEIINEPLEELDEEQSKERLSETVEQTLNRVKAEQAEKSANGDKSPAGDTSKAVGKQADSQGAKKEQPTGQEGQGEVLAAPQRFSPEAKAVWATVPKVLQEEYSKTIRDLEAGQHEKLRQIHQIKTQAETIVNGVQPWVKDWAANGISAPQGVALLAKTHERMLADPAKECARLILDNGCDFAKVQAHLTAFQQGTELPSGAATAQGNGYTQDIASHPQFLALQKRIDAYDNEIRQREVRTETDKIRALRDEVNQDGTKPYGEILNPDFLRYAHPLVSALRTPPRGPDGKFQGGPPMTLLDAYKRAYHTWQLENGNSFQNSATSPQLQNSQQQPRRPVQPVSMRPRSVPAGSSSLSPNGDQSKYLRETVEETMARVIREQQQGI